MLAKTPETPAPVGSLSAAQQIALFECHIAGALLRLRGFWGAPGTLAKIAGVTIADLVRDDMLTTAELGYRKSSARLTDRGAWYARTLALELARRGAE